MQFDCFGKVPDCLFGISVVKIEPSETQHCFGGFGTAGRVFQRSFVNLNRAVVFFDERKPGEVIIPVSLIEFTPDFELTLDDFIIVDPGDVSLCELLETIEFRAVFPCFPVSSCGADERIDFLYRFIRLYLRFQIGIRGGEEFPLIFQFSAGGKRFQSGFFIGGNGKDQYGGEDQKPYFQAHKQFFSSKSFVLFRFADYLINVSLM